MGASSWQIILNKGTLVVLYPVGLYTCWVLKIVLNKMFEKYHSELHSEDTGLKSETGMLASSSEVFHGFSQLLLHLQTVTCLQICV